MEGNGSETLETSNERTEMAKFMLEGSRGHFIVCFVLNALRMHELHNRKVSAGSWFVPQAEVNSYCVCSRSRSEKRNKQEFCALHKLYYPFSNAKNRQLAATL